MKKKNSYIKPTVCVERLRGEAILCPGSPMEPHDDVVVDGSLII